MALTAVPGVAGPSKLRYARIYIAPNGHRLNGNSTRQFGATVNNSGPPKAVATSLGDWPEGLAELVGAQRFQVWGLRESRWGGGALRSPRAYRREQSVGLIPSLARTLWSGAGIELGEFLLRGLPNMLVMPLHDGRSLFPEDAGYDADRQCWTIARYKGGPGKRHIIGWPWPRVVGRESGYRIDRTLPPLTACQYRLFASPDDFAVEWMDRKHVTCDACRRQHLPLSHVIPPGWPPPVEPADLLPMSDWWEERGGTLEVGMLRGEYERTRRLNRGI